MGQTIVQVTLSVTATTPDENTITPLDLVKGGLEETTISVPSFVPSGYSIDNLVIKGIVEQG